MSTYLFVYGTLRRGVGHPMHKLLSAGAEALGVATYAGRLFDLGPYPGVVPDPTGHWRVTGELYRLHQPESLLGALDEYEGCAPHSPQPHQYRRVLQPVRLAISPDGRAEHPEVRAMCPDGESVQAWVYIYNAPLDFLLDARRSGARQIESGDYLPGGQLPTGSGYDTCTDSGKDTANDRGDCIGNRSR